MKIQLALHEILIREGFITRLCYNSFSTKNGGERSRAQYISKIRFIKHWHGKGGKIYITIIILLSPDKYVLKTNALLRDNIDNNGSFTLISKNKSECRLQTQQIMNKQKITFGNFIDARYSIRLVPEDMSLIVRDFSTSAVYLSISAIGISKECPKPEDKLNCKVQEKKRRAKYFIRC